MKSEKFETSIEKIIVESAKKKELTIFKEKFASEMRGVA